MHVEIEVALNFIISYLYNKLPRRRVNIFGEELEKALKHKFQGHWYPDKPVKVRFISTMQFFRREKKRETYHTVHAPGETHMKHKMQCVCLVL